MPQTDLNDAGENQLSYETKGAKQIAIKNAE
jgi:hypothetical protein